jgi:hypothetical protein
MAMKLTRRQLVGSSIAAGLTLTARPPSARSEELTLRAVSAWTAGTAFSKPFERYVERVNETGKGLIKFNYLGGGAKIMNVFDMGKSLRTGVFDVLNSTSGYYGDLMPEANAMKLKTIPYAKFRANGGYEYFERLLQQKVNAHWVGRGKGDVPFNVISPSARRWSRNLISPDLNSVSPPTIAPSSPRWALRLCRLKGPKSIQRWNAMSWMATAGRSKESMS